MSCSGVCDSHAIHMFEKKYKVPDVIANVKLAFRRCSILKDKDMVVPLKHLPACL
jgi:hypothetical protein